MNGQWIGEYTGTRTGGIIVNADNRGTDSTVIIFLNDWDPQLPGVIASIRVPMDANSFHLELSRQDFSAINRGNAAIIPWHELLKNIKSEDLPTTVILDGKWTDTTCSLSWKTNLGSIGSTTLKRNQLTAKSKLQSKIKTWSAFKQFASKLDSRRYVFRGQRSRWRLVTGFHRTGRADLLRFLTEDVRILPRNLSARTKHIFDLSIPDQNGAFLNLIQHHGYPTPLLDWTYSPYVGAFFAYSGISKGMLANARTKEYVRIFVFDKKQWENDFPQIQFLSPTTPHFSLSEFIAIDNERMIPQQGLSSVSNISDIESYIFECEKKSGHVYLQAIDLPWTEREKVLSDLRMMGITAGSLFPGLDGACEEVKERMFSL